MHAWLPPPQPHPRPAAVLGDELDAGSFQGGADSSNGAALGSSLGQLQTGNRPLRNSAGARKLVL